MRPFLLSGFSVPGWLAGLPPTNPDVPSNVQPMGVLESYLLLGALVSAFWVGVRLVVWLQIKLQARKLFGEIHRDLGIGETRPTDSKRRRRA